MPLNIPTMTFCLHSLGTWLRQALVGVGSSGGCYDDLSCHSYSPVHLSGCRGDAATAATRSERLASLSIHCLPFPLLFSYGPRSMIFSPPRFRFRCRCPRQDNYKISVQIASAVGEVKRRTFVGPQCAHSLLGINRMP